MRTARISLLFAIVCISGSSFSAAQDCDLNCRHNSTCKLGAPSFLNDLPGGVGSLPFLDSQSKETAHCECHPGWTGKHCGRRYQSCGDGNHKCYHLGKCVDGNIDDFGNPQHFCDCRKAEFEGQRYVGKYCEHTPTTKCDQDGKYFCVNDGICKPNFAKHPDQPCNCGNIYEGPHCEYKKGEMPKCELECMNGGSCKLGLKSYEEAAIVLDAPFRIISHINYQHCSCPEGWTGLQCEIGLANCGDRVCLHGSKCMKDKLANGNIQYHCDCTAANTETESYSGIHCEHASTSFCTKNPNHNGHTFCTNGGKCQQGSDTLTCECPPGYTGARCEYKAGTEEKCDLTCSNGGKCRNGIKEMGDLKNLGLMQLVESLNKSHVQFKHCVCPTGYAGVRCETKIEACGEKPHAHICLFGSKCAQTGIDSNGKPIMGCDCENAFSKYIKMAGVNCEHASTKLCLTPGSETTGSAQFCTNGGECLEIASGHKEHAGCKCPPGYSGDHCEIVAASQKSPPSTGSPASEGDSRVEAGFLVAVTVVLAVVALAIVLFVQSRKAGEREIDTAAEDTPSEASYRDPPASVRKKNHPPESPERDADGNVLQNVEII